MTFPPDAGRGPGYPPDSNPPGWTAPGAPPSAPHPSGRTPDPQFWTSPHTPAKRNTLAVVTLVLGMLGGGLIAIGLGIAALVQIRRTGERGKGMAVGGIVAAVAWTAISAVLFVTLMTSDLADDSEGSSLQVFPRPGQCFDIRDDGNYPVLACTRPHDAEMILSFELPKGAWPGEREVSRLGDTGCAERLRARYGTRAPAENSDTYVLYPRQLGWRLGDRKVLCAVGATGDHKLSAPIPTGPSRFRALDELKPGDCFADPGSDTVTVKIMKCEGRHGAQLTHRFELPGGPYPGDAAAEKSAETGCDARWKRLFDRSPVEIEGWYFHPTEESWKDGDRLVQCYVTGPDGRDLTRSVVPR